MKKVSSPRFFLPKVRLIETATLEELEITLNGLVDLGYKIQEIKSEKNDFFQSHSAILTRRTHAFISPKTEKKKIRLVGK